MFVTVLSMSVVAAPEAGAAAQAGDLIKMDGLSSVYYLSADGKRYVFPNETTYFSWYADFSSVVTVPQSELESYPLGKNITVRPGTKLIKITTDPKVYAVEPGGSLVHVPDEDTAMSLWGDNWSQRVVDIADAFFTNYEVAEGQEVMADSYPAGSLVKWGDSADVYYIDEDGTARKVGSEAAFEANRFNWDDVVMAGTGVDMPAAGDDITDALGGITNTSAGAGGTAGAGTGLTVALAGDTAASASLPSYSYLVPFVTVNLTASNDGDVTVNALTFTRGGTGVTDDFAGTGAGGYLFVGDERLTTRRSINSSDGTITFTALNLKVPAGKTKAVTLKMNSADSANSNHYFRLNSVNAIDTNGAVVNGSFPIEGNTMAYTGSVNAATVTLDGGAYGDNTYKIGETDVVLGEFTINNDNEEIVSIRSIKLKQGDTASNDDINNISFYLDGELVKSDLVMVDKYLTIMLDTPYELEKGKTITATLRGDIVDGIGKHAEFYVKNVADVDVRGTYYGDFYSARIVATAFDAIDSSEADDVTISGSELNVSFDGPQAADIKDDQDDVVLANFKVMSASQDVSVDTLKFTLTAGGACNDSLSNVELVDSDNGVSYSGTIAASSTSSTILFENVYLEDSTQYTFELRGDIADNTTAGCSYKTDMTFNTTNFVAYYQDEDETSVSTSDLSSTSLTGKTMTVAAPSVTFSKIQTNASTVVKDAQGVLLFKGSINANNVDALKVSKVKLNAYSTDGVAQTLSNDFNKLTFNVVEADSTETELDSETSLGASSVTFSGFTLDIPKGVSNIKYVTVRGNVKSSPTATTTKMAWTGTTYSTSNYTVKDSDNNALSTGTVSGNVGNAGHLTTVVDKGTYTMAFDTTDNGLNKNQNVLAGSMVKLGKIKVTAAKENAIIEDLLIQASTTVSNYADNTDLAKVYLFEDENLTQPIANVVLAGVSSGNGALFEDINYEVSTDGVTEIYVAGLIKGIDYTSSPSADSTAEAGKNIKLRLLSSLSSYTTKIVGADTGETLLNTNLDTTTQTYTSTVMGATISSIDVSDLSDTLLAAGWKTVYKFKVTAPDSINKDYDGDALPVKLASTTLTLTKSSDVTYGAVKIKRVGGNTYTGTAATNLATSSTAITMNISDIITNAADEEIAPGETAEFEVIAEIVSLGTGTNKSFQVYIDNADTDLYYTHNTGTSGSDGADATAVNALLTTTDFLSEALTN